MYDSMIKSIQARKYNWKLIHKTRHKAKATKKKVSNG